MTLSAPPNFDRADNREVAQVDPCCFETRCADLLRWIGLLQ